MLPGISFFGGGIPVNPGSQTFSSAGTYLFTVPAFNTLTVELWGAGGAGGAASSSYAYSPSGGGSSFHTASAPGGGGGQGAYPNFYGAGGAGGSPAVGNVTATNGNAGYAGNSANRGYGAGAPNGGGDVIPGFRVQPSTSGSSPGGGGAGFFYDTVGKFPYVAGGGGSGAYALSIFTPASLTPGTVLSVVVGAGGVDPLAYGGPGADGKIIVTWA